MRVEFITVDEWIDDIQWAPYFANRNVNPRMRKSHLNGEHNPSQAVVHAMQYPTGLRVKLDGHSRAEAWRRNQLTRPEHLTVIIHDVRDDSEAAVLYDAMTSKAAAATPSEEMYTAMQRTGFVPQSKLGKSKAWKSAWLAATGQADVSTALMQCADAMLDIDALNINKDRCKEYSTGIRAAMILSFQRDRQLAERFWTLYNENDGSVAEINSIYRTMENITGSSGTSVMMLQNAALGAFETFSNR